MVDDLQLAGNLGKSDHSCFSFRVLTEDLALETKEFWLYNKGNYDKNRVDLDIDWTSLLEQKTAQESAD